MEPISKNRLSQNWKRVQLISRRLDFIQLIPMLLLLIIGVLFIYSTGQQVGGKAEQFFWQKQIQWIIIGFTVWLILSLVNYRLLSHLSGFIYLASIISLILVLFYGLKIYGARRWLDLGGIRVQPSEFAKLAVLIMISWLLSLKRFSINRLSSLVAVFLIAGVPFFLILKEPDLGSALVLVPMVASLVFVAKIKWKLILIGFVAAIIILPAAYYFLEPYQKQRLITFIFPKKDIRGSGWNSYQAGLAVGSGGISGKGYMQGTQHTLGYLPRTISNTDFIFSVIAEESGFIGAISLLGLYSLLIFSILRTAVVARDAFGRFLAVGTAALFFTHSFINIGMNIRLMPITGLPLPLISYGGSFLLSSMIYLGILQSIYAHRRTRENRPTNEA